MVALKNLFLRRTGKFGSNKTGAVRARRDAWELAKDVCKLKKESKDTFYSLAEARVFLAPDAHLK